MIKTMEKQQKNVKTIKNHKPIKNDKTQQKEQ